MAIVLAFGRQHSCQSRRPRHDEVFFFVRGFAECSKGLPPQNLPDRDAVVAPVAFSRRCSDPSFLMLLYHTWRAQPARHARNTHAARAAGRIAIALASGRPHACQSRRPRHVVTRCSFLSRVLRMFQGSNHDAVIAPVAFSGSHSDPSFVILLS